MSDTLEEHNEKVSISNRTIINLMYADDLDAVAKEEQGLEALAESLDKTSTRLKMEMLMTNRANGIQMEIKVNRVLERNSGVESPPELTLEAPVTTAADDFHKCFFIVFQRK